MNFKNPIISTGPKGITWFHPDSLVVSNYNPPVVLTGFKIFNKETGILASSSNKVSLQDELYIIPRKITYLKDIVLTYHESVFSFSFSSLDYYNPEENSYAYLMEGFEEDWNYVGFQNTATYTNLDAGKYIFRVKGTNSSGIWSNNETALTITILPPFWETNWFRAIVIISLLLILIFIIWQILLYQKRKALAEKEKIELQLKTIKNQIDPHFAFNAINMIGSLVYKNDPDTVYDYFSRFAKLIRSTLQDSAKIARPLEEELDFVNNYVEIQRTRFKGKFDYTINIKESIDLGINVPKMIIQTYVENAIKHGLMHKKDKGHLILDIYQENRVMKIKIEDDGIGRKKAAEYSKSGTRKGMQIVKQIFSMYNELNNHQIHQEIVDLYDNRNNANGTRVILTIELKGQL